MEQLSEYMPYFTSIICALISGIVTYIVSRKQTKNEINKLIKQHELNLESQRKQYEHEIAILNLEHEHQLKLKDKELENKLSGDMMNTLISEAMKNPEIKRQFNQGVTDGLKKHALFLSLCNVLINGNTHSCITEYILSAGKS